MFLKNITVNKYRSIQHARADFENGLNIIIGKNGVGKSNLLKYINKNLDYTSLVTFTKRHRNTNVEFECTVCYNDQDENPNELSINFKQERFNNNGEIDFRKQIKWSKKNNHISLYKDRLFEVNTAKYPTPRNEHQSDFFQEFEYFTFLQKQYVAFELPYEPKWLEKSMKYELDSESRIDYDSNVASSDFDILWHLQAKIELAFNFKPVQTKTLRDNQDLTKEHIINELNFIFDEMKSSFDLDNILAKYSPIESIQLNPNINIYLTENKILIDNLFIEFRINNAWVPWYHLSDGTKRLFYLITQCLSVTDGIVLIEEPELGIHPHQLHSLMQFIYEQSRYKQIIISTHSPIVLDVLSPDDLHRITIAKLTPTGSQFYKLTGEQKDKAKEYMEKVGDLSYYWLHSDLEDE